jgi:hypothetical protein
MTETSSTTSTHDIARLDTDRIGSRLQSGGCVPRATPREVLTRAWAAEIEAAASARSRRDLAQEWAHLERAHVISQPMAGGHVRTHLAMLRYGLERRDAREVLGQVIRAIVAGPGSRTGRYPVGNTGGARVSALRPMPVPDDLRPLLEGVTPNRRTGTSQAVRRMGRRSAAR